MLIEKSKMFSFSIKCSQIVFDGNEIDREIGVKIL